MIDWKVKEMSKIMTTIDKTKDIVLCIVWYLNNKTVLILQQNSKQNYLKISFYCLKIHTFFEYQDKKRNNVEEICIWISVEIYVLIFFAI